MQPMYKKKTDPMHIDAVGSWFFGVVLAVAQDLALCV